MQPDVRRRADTLSWFEKAHKDLRSQNKLERLEEAIHGIKREIEKLGALQQGSPSKQARKAKTTYGAYWHLSHTHLGKGHTQYIRDAFVRQVKVEIANFKCFNKLIDRLITLSIQRSQLVIGCSLLSRCISKS